MKINKQLFEDILSGKLKGTFVMRNGNTYFSSSLRRNYNIFRDTHPYVINLLSYTPEGRYSEDDVTSTLDVADFMPYTFEIDPEFYSYNQKDIEFVEHLINDYHMKENELTIEIPDGKIVDWEESKKQNKIVLKDKQLTYVDVCKKLFKGKTYYTGANGEISSIDATQYATNPNNATTKHQLECLLAKNKLANVAKYLNDGWKPNKGDHVFYLTGYDDFENKVYVGGYYFGEGENLILFKTQKVAQQAIEILGEEIIKLALEPLGI